MKRLISLGTLVLTCWFAIEARAQENLPSGKDVVDRSVSESGGKEAFSKIKTIAISGKVNVPEANLQGTISIQYATPDKARILVEFPSIGLKTEQGIKGDVGWEMAANTGNRLMKDKETERLLDTVSLRAVFEPESIYESMKNTGIESVDGQRCYKLEMSRKKGGDVDTIYYSLDTGFPVKSISNRATAQGDSMVESTFSNYKEVDGIKTPTRMAHQMKALNITQVVEFETFDFNRDIKDSVFTLPAPIQRLVK